MKPLNKTIVQPLFDSRRRFLLLPLDDYPQVNAFVKKLNEQQRLEWQHCREYLKFVARNKADGTFDRFRNELERFVLWCWQTQDLGFSQLKKIHILEYADFLWSPPSHWIGLNSAVKKFELRQGHYQTNEHWRPFVVRASKTQTKEQKSKASTQDYKISQASLTASFVALSTFFKYMIDMDYLGNNPVNSAKKDCRYLIKQAQVQTVHRLSDIQWQMVLDAAQQMADQDSEFERHLFLVASLKTLYLRISELSERDKWQPVMSHFWQQDGYWWLKVYGVSDKIHRFVV